MRTVAILALICVGCGITDKLNDACQINDECVLGSLCVDKKCVDTTPVEIITSNLPEGLKGAEYGSLLAAQYGHPPYVWSLVKAPEWLSVQSTTGQLRGTPDVPGLIDIELRVSDSTTGRDSQAQKSFRVKIATCSAGNKVDCTDIASDKCLIGEQNCVLGDWAICENKKFSVDFERCGSTCAICDQTKATVCKDGACFCGTELACSSLCCEETCIDKLTDVHNCGACERDCANETNFVVRRTCTDGSCDYEGPGTNGVGCTLAHLDCDGNRANGCESEHTNNDCAACGDTCVNSLCILNEGKYFCGCNSDRDCGDGRLCCNQKCVDSGALTSCGSCENDCTLKTANVKKIECSAGVCNYDECMAAYTDCDKRRENGCETNMFLDPQNCGYCGKDCSAQSPYRGICVEGKCDVTCLEGYSMCANQCFRGDIRECKGVCMANIEYQKCEWCGSICESTYAKCVNGVCI